MSGRGPSKIANRIYDPLTTGLAGAANSRTVFSNNTIPTSRLSPQAIYFNKYIPLANTAAGTALFTPSNACHTSAMCRTCVRCAGASLPP